MHIYLAGVALNVVVMVAGTIIFNLLRMRKISGDQILKSSHFSLELHDGDEIPVMAFTLALIASSWFMEFAILLILSGFSVFVFYKSLIWMTVRMARRKVVPWKNFVFDRDDN